MSEDVTHKTIDALLCLLGWEYATEGPKCQGAADAFCALGVQFVLSDMHLGRVYISNTEKRVNNLLESIKEARRPPQVDYVLLFGPTEKGKIGMQFFLSFEPGFSALVFHGVSFTHSDASSVDVMCSYNLHPRQATTAGSWKF